MVATSFLIHIPCVTFIIFLTIPLSTGNDVNYTVCSSSSLYSCGQIRSVGYPFWSENRPEFCGIQDLKLQCNNSDNITTMSLGYYTFLVHDIDTSSHIMTLSRVPLKDIYCWELTYKNRVLPPTLKTTTGVVNISIFYACPKAWATENRPRSFNCSNPDGTKGFAYYSDGSSAGIGINQKCNYSGIVPVNNSRLDELNKNSSMLLSVLLQKFKLEYVANFTACRACVNSGGSCGSAYQSTTFVCYCPAGPQPFKCPNSVAVRAYTRKEQMSLFLGLGIGGIILVIAALLAFWYRRKLKFTHSKFLARSVSLDHSGSEVEKGSVFFGVSLFTYSELQEATDNFDQSRELGDGGFGTVYYGKLRDGRDVAVKRLYEKNYRRVEQFMNEVQILTCLRHQNLVSLYGCTSHHSKELLLVYEFVRNGTVADHLYGEKAKSGPLSWSCRLRIAIETANALCYLHASDIIHRDIKTHNILLDSNFSVKVADFGLSRLFPNDTTHVSTAPQGTPGYLDPEYHQCYQLTVKSDVYSFGVVLVELISSLPAVDMSRHRHEINLSNYAMTRIQRCAFDELVDPGLGFLSDFKVKRMTTAVGELAFQCLQHDKEFRPSMNEILDALRRIETTNYEALETEELARNNAGLQGTNPPLSPIQADHAELLSNQQRQPSSPISVMDKWASKSTTPSTSK